MFKTKGYNKYKLKVDFKFKGDTSNSCYFVLL